MTNTPVRDWTIVARRRRWYLLSAILIVLSISGVVVRGLHPGIEFTGGADFIVPSRSCSVTDVRTAAAAAGLTQPQVTAGSDSTIRVRAAADTADRATSTTAGLAEACHVPTTEVAVQVVGPSWGADITRQALIGLAVFLAAVALFLAAYFTPRMAAAALIALIHDLAITIGIYAWSSFDVTPATILGLLTILGYSLYDCVVVFDKVKETSGDIRGGRGAAGRFARAANDALNHTIARSINTTLVALLPVVSILVVSWTQLGPGTLTDLALALAVGITVGAYSSLFLATPLLVDLTRSTMSRTRRRARPARSRSRTTKARRPTTRARR